MITIGCRHEDPSALDIELIDGPAGTESFERLQTEPSRLVLEPDPRQAELVGESAHVVQRGRRVSRQRRMERPGARSNVGPEVRRRGCRGVETRIAVPLDRRSHRSCRT